jgi:phenylalanyl-tRNA synthetase beta chain
LLPRERIQNKIYSVGRSTLQPGLLKILSHNATAPRPVNIYEIGDVLNLVSDQEVYENLSFSFVCLSSKSSFAVAKSYIQTLLKELNIPFTLDLYNDKRYIQGRSAAILVHNRQIGHFGEIHPEILNSFSINEPVSSGEIDSSALAPLLFI